jgi:hypothetical protein
MKQSIRRYRAARGAEIVAALLTAGMIETVHA